MRTIVVHSDWGESVDTYHAFFGNLFAEELGRSLMEYFESKDFPKRLLRDPTLNSFCLRTRIYKILSDRSLSDMTSAALICAAFDEYYERGGTPFPISAEQWRR